MDRLAAGEMQHPVCDRFDHRIFTRLCDILEAAYKGYRHAGAIVCSLRQHGFLPPPTAEYRQHPSGSSDHSGRLQPFADGGGQVVALIMCRRHQNRPFGKPAVFRELQIAFRRFLQVVGFPFMNKTVLLECIESRLKIAVGTIGNPGAVVLGLLPTDRSQLEACNPGMVFQQPEEVAAFNGSMLPGVADEQHPVVVLVGEPDNLRAFA